MAFFDIRLHVESKTMTDDEEAAIERLMDEVIEKGSNGELKVIEVEVEAVEPR
jgi:uncharacterized protein YggL (DUF469 family)